MKPEPNAFTKCRQIPYFSPAVFFLFCFILTDLMVVEFNSSLRTVMGEANRIRALPSDPDAFTGSTSDGSLPVTARWLQPGPLGKNPH